MSSQVADIGLKTQIGGRKGQTNPFQQIWLMMTLREKCPAKALGVWSLKPT